MTPQGLLTPFVLGLLRDCHNFYADNQDAWRFYPFVGAEKWKRAVLGWLASRGLTRRGFLLKSAEAKLAHIFQNLSSYEKVYAALGNDASRKVFLDLLRFRVLGRDHVWLGRNDAAFHRFRQEADQKYLRKQNVGKSLSWSLHRYEAPGREGSIHVDMHAYSFCITFLQQHYAYQEGDVQIQTEPGDVVLDAGGCWGDTALYFADQAGAAGRVFTWEFDAENLRLLRSNLSLNSALESRVEIIPRAMWSKSDVALSFNPAGPSSALKDGQVGTETVHTLSIDDFVRERALERLDFIKMDIEGAELAALQGGVEALRRFRPKLAISLYHKPEDFFEIPEFIQSLNLGYELFISHHTIHDEETVLFARAPRS